MSDRIPPFVVRGDDPRRLAATLRELADMLESGQLATKSGGILLSARHGPDNAGTPEFSVFSDLVLRAKQ